MYTVFETIIQPNGDVKRMGLFFHRFHLSASAYRNGGECFLEGWICNNPGDILPRRSAAWRRFLAESCRRMVGWNKRMLPIRQRLRGRFFLLGAHDFLFNSVLRRAKSDCCRLLENGRPPVLPWTLQGRPPLVRFRAGEPAKRPLCVGGMKT